MSYLTKTKLEEKLFMLPPPKTAFIQVLVHVWRWNHENTKLHNVPDKKLKTTCKQCGYIILFCDKLPNIIFFIFSPILKSLSSLTYNLFRQHLHIKLSYTKHDGFH